MLSNSLLCSTCQGLLLLKEIETGLQHHPTIAALVKAATNGCPLCVWILDAYAPFFEGLDVLQQNSSKWQFSIRLIYRKKTQSLLYRIRTRALPKLSDNINLLLLPVIDTDLQPFCTLEPTTGGKLAIENAKSWLMDCEENHPACKPSQTWFPKRVLDVGTENDPSLCLYLHEHAQVNPPFVTLSHCWGKMKTLRLLQSNLADMVRGISPLVLPRTFQEAISFTRRLGIKYIWIDSLCIIQDSYEDWIEQSSQMSKVYSYSTCNIAATGAADGTHGLFFHRNPLLAQPCRLYIPSLEAENSPIGLYDIISQEMWSQNIEKAPLNVRAWVLQEQFLAPRILHFGKNQLFWECRTKAACEMFPRGITNPWVHEDYTFQFKWMGQQAKMSFPQCSSAFLDNVNVQYLSPGCQLWNTIIGQYTSRLLSQEEDKLIAIAGVAQEIESKVLDQVRDDEFGYLAGLWGQFLPAQLVWTCFNYPPDEVHTRPKSYRAPSWSWASINATVMPLVTPLPPNQRFMIHIHYASTETVGHRMAQVKGGSITLTGWLHNLDITTEDVLKGYVVREWTILIGIAFDVSSEFKVDDTKYFLPILECTGEGDVQPEVHGLIIQETETGRYEFRRVGTFCTSAPVACNRFRRPTYDPIHPPIPRERGLGAPISRVRSGSVDVWAKLPDGNGFDDNALMPGFEKSWSEHTITLI